MEIIKKVYNVLHKIRIVSIISLLIFIILLCTTNVVLRYLISRLGARPFSWADEIMRMLIIWVAFLSASLGVKEGSHISLESFMQKYVTPRAANILKRTADIVVVVVLLILIYFGIRQTVNARLSYLQNLPITNAWFYAAIPVGSFYLFIDYLLILCFGKHPFSEKKSALDKLEIENGGNAL